MKAWSSVVESTIFKIIVTLFPLGVGIGIVYWRYDQLELSLRWRDYVGLLWRTLLIYPLSLFAQAYAWFLLLSSVGEEGSLWREGRIYLYTYLMKRLPGAVWYLGGRVALYKRQNIGTATVLVGSATEVILLSVTALTLWSVLTFVMPFLEMTAQMPWRWLLAGMIFTGCIVGMGYLLGRLQRITLPSWLGGKSYTLFRTRSGVALTMVLFAYSLAYGIGGWILLWIVSALGGNGTYLPMLRCWVLAGGVGSLLAAFMPVGSGGRDVSLWTLLLPWLPSSTALLAVVLLRILFLLGDVVWGGMGWMIAERIDV